MDKAAKASLEQAIFEAAKVGAPVRASEFARHNDADERQVKLAIRRMVNAGRLYQAQRPMTNFFGSTEAGYKATCETPGCCRVGGHKGQHEILDRS